MSPSAFTHLECSDCGERRPPSDGWGVCRCGHPLLARYDLDRARASLGPRPREDRHPTLWSYAPLLPLLDPSHVVTLGEGGAPVLRSVRWGPRRGLPRLHFQWEGSNPTLSFKARGAAVAVSRARELGLGRLALPSAGNAGSALAAYAAAAGIEALVAVPEGIPRALKEEARALGAEVMEVPGGLPEAARALGERVGVEGWTECSTWKEPYRVEGKKTMGFEIAERFGEDLPDAIVFPTGGGVGIVALWKAFDEMERIGWIGARRPRLIAVQVEGCAPIVEAIAEGKEDVELWPDPRRTAAVGLQVPSTRGGKLILQALRDSRGTAVAVPEDQVLAVGRELAAEEGIWTSPEGAAALAATVRMAEDGMVGREEVVLVFLTASGLKYSG